eukprot:190272_1
MSLFRGRERSQRSQPKSKRHMRINKKKTNQNLIFKRRTNLFPQTPINMCTITTHIQSGAQDNYQELDLQFGSKYKYIHDISRCIFGKVFKVMKIKAKDQDKDPKYYAIKMKGNLFNSPVKTKRFLRELRILRLLSSHESIIELVDLVPPSNPAKFDTLCVVFEYMSNDLKSILKSNQYFSDLHIEYILYQLLLGIKYIHSAGIIHCDLNPENILIDGDCRIRISDFRSAHTITQYKQNMHNNQSVLDRLELKPPELQLDENGALLPAAAPLRLLRRNAIKHPIHYWYRAPEAVLLQQQKKEDLYAMDIWSVGCILGELLQMNQNNCPDYQKRHALFPGNTCFPLCVNRSLDYHHRTDQLRLIFDLIGTPPMESALVNGFHENVQIYLKHMSTSHPKDLFKLFPGTKPCGIELLSKMLTFDAHKRINVHTALQSNYFDNVRDTCAENRHLKFPRTIKPLYIVQAAIRQIVMDSRHISFQDICQVICKYVEWNIFVPRKDDHASQMKEENELRAKLLDEVMYFNPKWRKKLKQ